MLGDVVYEVLQLVGILAFALSGALIGVRKNLDVLGVIVVGSFTGVGSGVVRDMLLGVHPPVSFEHWPNLAVALAGSVIVFFFHPSIARLPNFAIVFDAVGLGLFSANGAAVVYSEGTHWVTAVLVGIITAIGGGVIRDIMVNTVPAVLTRELYAVSAIVGSLSAVGIMALGGGMILASVVGGTLAITLRITSAMRGWNLPRPRPMTSEDAHLH